MIKDALYLTEIEKKALREIKRRVSGIFSVKQYILFGSKARGEAAIDSDIDLLIVTEKELEHSERHRISNEITHINLEFGTLFSFITICEQEWNSEMFSLMPIYDNISRDGVTV
jgi:predicted nucleotidyltransferase